MPAFMKRYEELQFVMKNFHFKFIRFKRFKVDSSLKSSILSPITSLCKKLLAHNLRRLLELSKIRKVADSIWQPLRAYTDHGIITIST
jgi:hypothetical protein